MSTLDSTAERRQGPLSEIARERVVASWANAIGAPLENLRRDEWIFVERSDLRAVVVVRVDGFSLLAAPPRILSRLRSASDESLLDAAALAELLPAGAEPIGSADLFFAEHPPSPGRHKTSAAGLADTTRLRRLAGASEWEESGIEEAENRWVALDPEECPTAVAGFTPWQSELAQMAVLAGPQYRGAGFAYAAAAAATQTALSDGLIAQWRSRRGNEPSCSLAHRLGYTPLGVQAAVSLNC